MIALLLLALAWSSEITTITNYSRLYLGENTIKIENHTTLYKYRANYHPLHIFIPNATALKAVLISEAELVMNNEEVRCNSSGLCIGIKINRKQNKRALHDQCYQVPRLYISIHRKSQCKRKQCHRNQSYACKSR
jgi:hypothetical protein